MKLQTELPKHGPITGFYMLPDKVYRKAPGISQSELSMIKRSPFHYQAWTKYKYETDAMRKGTAAHMCLLEYDRFLDHYAIAPQLGGPKNRNPWKKEWDEFKLANEGKDILSYDEAREYIKMRDVATNHKLASKLISNGIAEVSMFWQDPVTGIQCKARLDYKHPTFGVVDYKTSTDARPFSFQRSITSFSYHLQTAYYLDGLACLDAEEPMGWFWIVQEKTFPYALNVFMPTEAMIEKGRQEYRDAITTYIDCREKDHWPSYSEEINLIDLPDWSYRDDDENEEPPF